MSSSANTIPIGSDLLSDPRQACLAAGLQQAPPTDPTSLLRLNVDTLATIVADHGPAAEQAVVSGVSRMLREAVRPTDDVQHTGSAQFAVLFRNTPLDEVLDTATRTQRRIESVHFENRGRAFQLTLSGGLAIQELEEDLAGVTARADAALQGARNSGAKQIYWHDGRQVRDLDRASILAAARPAPVATPGDQAEEMLADLQALRGRTTFCQNLRRFLMAARSAHTPLAVLLTKLVNYDTLVREHGTRAGDLALTLVLPIAQSCGIRPVLVARYAPQTLILLLSGNTAQKALALGDEVRRAVAERTFLIDGMRHRVTLRPGVATASARDDITTLLTRAERMLADPEDVSRYPSAVAVD